MLLVARPPLQLVRRLGWLVVASVVGVVKAQIKAPLRVTCGSRRWTCVVARPVIVVLWSQLFS